MAHQMTKFPKRSSSVAADHLRALYLSVVWLTFNKTAVDTNYVIVIIILTKVILTNVTIRLRGSNSRNLQ